jgi:hypothetical protein
VKELHLHDLLALAEASAQDSICDLWNQKSIHYLVVFTSPDADFEIIGVGPTLQFTNVDDAARHTVPGKQPEFFVKCPAAIAGRLQPKLAPTLMNPGSAVVPSLKGRTSIPFPNPPIKLTPQAPAPAPATPPEPPPTPAAPAPQLETQNSKLETREANLETDAPASRFALLEQRERELAALAASLKIRETALKEREAAVAASEEQLLKRPPGAG